MYGSLIALAKDAPIPIPKYTTMVQTTQLYISHYLNLLHLISLSPGHPSSDHPKNFFDSGSPSAANNISVFLMQHGVLPRTALTSFVTSCSDVIDLLSSISE